MKYKIAYEYIAVEARLKENILGEIINTTQGGVIYSINFGPLIKTLGSYFCTVIGITSICL